MRKAAVLPLLALILSNALVVANHAKSTGYENTVQHTVASVEAIQAESDTKAKTWRLLSANLPADQIVAAPKRVEKKPQPASETSEQASISAEEVELLARIVSAEAKSEPYKGQVAVAAVVLNRVEEGFGDSIKEVIYSKGQFQPVSNGTINHEPVDSAYDAAKEALNGKDPTKGAVYFANMDIADHHPNPKASKTVKIGDHTFYK